MKKVKRPGRIEPVSLCASRLLPGAVHGVRGAVAPLHPLHPRTPLCAGTRNLSPESGCTPPAAWRAGVGADITRPFRPGDVRACCGAPSALRASGIAFAPAPSLHQRQGAEGVTLPGGSEGGKLADGRAAVCPPIFGGVALSPRVLPFSKLKRSNAIFQLNRLNVLVPPEKARWGKDGGPGGKETPLAR